MIYVSTACVKNKFIGSSVKQLASLGYQNIELSGGTNHYDGMIDDLLDLKSKYDLNYLCHNYFPPPEHPFVINLASLDVETFDLTFKNISKALEISETLSADKFAFHAGFLINIPTDEIGKPITNKPLFDRSEAKAQFEQAFNEISRNTNIKLYIENNVLSAQNFKNFKRMNPLFICDKVGYLEFKSNIDFTLLLDVAHLKVSSKTLGLNFDEQLKDLCSESDYIHISDNDGLADTNNTFKKDSDLFASMQSIDLKNKIFTVEVYDGEDAIEESYLSIQNLIKE